jgi:hypothetical protein
MQTLMPAPSTISSRRRCAGVARSSADPVRLADGNLPIHHSTEREIDMIKTLTALVIAAFAVMSAQAASHAGAAPAKADAAKPAASAAKKAEKKADMKKDEKKADMKKEEPKK